MHKYTILTVIFVSEHELVAPTDVSSTFQTFTALTLFHGCQEQHLVCNK